jgi:hypothetical protein
MTTPAAPTDVLAHYEAVRREALETPAARGGHGLALLLTRGLPAWLAVLATLVPRRPAAALDAAAPAPLALRVPRTVRAELTTVLAGMVLACTAEADA